MALIIEDGTNVPNANSFVTAAEAIAYGAARGVVLVADATTDVLAVKAMDYIVMLSPRLKGKITYPDQTLPFPRTGVFVYGAYIPIDVIPTDVKQAQLALILLIKSGIDVLPTQDYSSGFIVREKVDVIETQYSEAVALAAGNIPAMPLVESLLSVYLGTDGFGLKSVRI